MDRGSLFCTTGWGVVWGVGGISASDDRHDAASCQTWVLDNPELVSFPERKPKRVGMLQYVRTYLAPSRIHKARLGKT